MVHQQLLQQGAAWAAAKRTRVEQDGAEHADGVAASASRLQQAEAVCKLSRKVIFKLFSDLWMW